MVSSNSRKRKRKEKKPQPRNHRERAADQRHRVVSHLKGNVGPSTSSPGAEQSLVELGRVWWAPIYERLLIIHFRFQMDKKLKCPLERPSFRVFLVGDDFSQHLRIPPAFIKNFNGRRLGKCTMRGPTGKCWAVELEQRRDGLFFHKGWPGFVKDHFIESEDFLIFDYDGGSEFDVTIYDKTCCEKDVKAAAKRLASDHLAETSTGGPILFKSENACFTKTFKPRDLYSLLIPKSIAVTEGLMSSEGVLIKETIMLQDRTGRSWLVQLDVTCDGRLEMKRGWRTCQDTNQISHGDTIIFEFVKQGVILHIFRGRGEGNSSSVVVLSGVLPRKSSQNP
ncbi:unnamed protein product [Prunus armeniaca]|uniref:TF-B3 domain-containing protein n=1 Tax=Prunus armeniaca TaxID=36596 RepID=A0A6J5TQ56_PRUAR|nr:unnamed protein product [Prunus armeniaca]